MYDNEYDRMRQEQQYLASERDEISNHRLLAETFGDGDDEDDEEFSDEPRDDTYDERIEDEDDEEEALDDEPGFAQPAHGEFWPKPIEPTVEHTPDCPPTVSAPDPVTPPPPPSSAKRSTAKKKARAGDRKAKLNARKAKKSIGRGKVAKKGKSRK